jgi:hypothetical protein
MSSALDPLLDALAEAIAARVAERLPAPPAPAPRQPQWLSPKAAAAHLGLAVKTLEEWRARGEGPKAHKVGKRALRYALADLEAFARRGGRS